ncbi:MAG: hypothetical protein KF754_11195 [Planctomycetes bacterium]|nr:hypothetical protein [Planctomycetota bacterium]
MKRILCMLVLALSAGAAGYFLAPQAGPVEAQAAKPEPIADVDAHLATDEAFKSGDLAKKLEIVTQLQKEQRINYNQAKGQHIRLILAHARASEMNPDTQLLKFVAWLGTQQKDYNGTVYKACSGTGTLTTLIEYFGTARLYADEQFKTGDLKVKIKRVKDLWDARELGQSQAYNLTADLAYQYLAPAGGKIDAELKLFGELHRANIMDWAGSAGIHNALLHRALFEKADLDTTEKRLAFIQKVTTDKTGDLSWMVVGSLRTSMFMLVCDAEMAGLDAKARSAKIDEWFKQGLLSSSDTGTLKTTYSVK